MASKRQYRFSVSLEGNDGPPCSMACFIRITVCANNNKIHLSHISELRTNAPDVTHDVSEGTHVFKARALNKKILSSRGDMGVFKNSKRETTVPLVWLSNQLFFGICLLYVYEWSFLMSMQLVFCNATHEFSFHSEKRAQPDLPIDLFSKLSIKSELQPKNVSRTRFPQAKGSKENRVNSFQAGNEVTKMPVGKPLTSAGNQIQPGNSRTIPETNQQWKARRSLGIR